MKRNESALLHYECNSLRLNSLATLCTGRVIIQPSSVLCACRASDQVSGQTLLIVVVSYAK